MQSSNTQMESDHGNNGYVKTNMDEQEAIQPAATRKGHVVVR
jgi:hypothetical protein